MPTLPLGILVTQAWVCPAQEKVGLAADICPDNSVSRSNTSKPLGSKNYHRKRQTHRQEGKRVIDRTGAQIYKF